MTYDMPRRTPNAAHLLDRLLKDLHIKNDAALAKAMGLTPPHVSKLRSGLCPLSAEVLLRIYDRTDYTIEELRAMLAVQEREPA